MPVQSNISHQRLMHINTTRRISAFFALFIIALASTLPFQLIFTDKWISEARSAYEINYTFDPVTYTRGHKDHHILYAKISTLKFASHPKTIVSAQAPKIYISEGSRWLMPIVRPNGIFKRLELAPCFENCINIYNDFYCNDCQKTRTLPLLEQISGAENIEKKYSLGSSSIIDNNFIISNTLLPYAMCYIYTTEMSQHSNRFHYANCWFSGQERQLLERTGFDQRLLNGATTLPCSTKCADPIFRSYIIRLHYFMRGFH